uniref:Uncharacterized protein n=1 Tax=Chrysotila carterae TaxID=13221 RepID=A0A7S4BP89_CHRCT
MHGELNHVKCLADDSHATRPLPYVSVPDGRDAKRCDLSERSLRSPRSSAALALSASTRLGARPPVREGCALPFGLHPAKAGHELYCIGDCHLKCHCTSGKRDCKLSICFCTASDHDNGSERANCFTCASASDRTSRRRIRCRSRTSLRSGSASDCCRQPAFRAEYSRASRGPR